MQTVKCCSLHIPLLFGWQSCLQRSFKQCNSMYDGLFPPDPEGTAFTQAWLTPHGGEYPRYTVFPSPNTNKHQHPPHLRCLLEEWFHLQSLVSPGQSSSCHLAPSSVSWCGSRSSRCSGGARGWSAISSGCWSSAWGPESSGWSWGMAGVVSWPLSQTCPRCHWKRLNTRLQENGAGESSFQHSSAPRGTTGARSTEHENTACLGERVCDLWTLCKLYCTPERGICPAMGISHNLTHLSHFLPHYLSLWKIADGEVFLMQIFIQVFLMEAWFSC